MSILVRIIVVFFALTISILAAGLALAIGVMTPDWVTMSTDPVEHFAFLSFAFFATSFAFALTFLPALALIAIAETFDIRSVLYYGFGGLAIGALAYFGVRESISVQLENTTDLTPVAFSRTMIAASGIIGGFVYWLIAGRKAGAWKRTL